MSEKKNVIIFGPPGCGKGTQSKKIVEYYEYTHLSTGDILRSEILSNTMLGKKAKNFLDNGQLVEDYLVNEMIKSKIEQENRSKGLLFDGYPRTIEQVLFLDSILKALNLKIDGLLFISVSEEDLIKRILSRGKTSERMDDIDRETILRRLKDYQFKTLSIKDHYSKDNIVFPIQGGGEIEEVFKSIQSVLDSL